MDSMEFNKIFAAVLVAGIIASLSGFIAHKAIHPHELHEDAIHVEGIAGGGGGGAVEAMPEPILAMIADADAAKGEKLSKACAACHTFNPGGDTLTGPNLHGIVGRGKGGVSGFAYSEGMAAMGGRWTYADLNKFLWKPKKFVDGTKMNYIGMKKPEDRAALIAWLRTLGGAPLPSSSEIAAEMAELAPPVADAAEEAGGVMDAVGEAVEGAVDAVTDH